MVSGTRRVGALNNGTNAFMLWLESMNKQKHQPNDSLDIPIVLRKFIKENRLMLYDKNLHSEMRLKLMNAFHFVNIAN